MNADQFIRAHGIEKAREVLDGSPEWAKAYNPRMKKYTDGFVRYPSNVFLGDLKRLVDSSDSIDMGDDAHIENHISPNCKQVP